MMVYLMPFLEALEPHAERGELELPTALQAMMDAGHNMGQWDVEQEVLDLTRLQDVDLVQKGLHLVVGFSRSHWGRRVWGRSDRHSI